MSTHEQVADEIRGRFGFVGGIKKSFYDNGSHVISTSFDVSDGVVRLISSGKGYGTHKCVSVHDGEEHPSIRSMDLDVFVRMHNKKL